jgi:hypothetical protein
MVQANPEESHQFSNSVVAIFEAEDAREVAAALRAANFRAEVLSGEDGRAHLDATAEGGLLAGLRKMARSFGDESRIVGALNAAMEEGKTVISVDANEDQAPEVARILEEKGGTYLWRFGQWSFNRVGETPDEEPEQAPEAAKGTVDEKAAE